jgi:hypothetical protein
METVSILSFASVRYFPSHSHGVYHHWNIHCISVNNCIVISAAPCTVCTGAVNKLCSQFTFWPSLWVEQSSPDGALKCVIKMINYSSVLFQYMGSFPVAGPDQASRAEYMRTQIQQMRVSTTWIPMLVSTHVYYRVQFHAVCCRTCGYRSLSSRYFLLWFLIIASFLTFFSLSALFLLFLHFSLTE